jgi:cytochrome oxidase Cu insertion factor (SCO1/SenC/PrrC family)
MRLKHDLTGGLVLTLMMLTACAPTATGAPATTMEEASTAKAMSMDNVPTAAVMMRTGVPTAESMLMHETPAPESMAPTPAPSMNMADWLGTSLIDASTDAPFRIADYHGKIVLVETMAVWCTNCRAQQEEMRGLESHMMEQTNDLVIVSLDIDPNEDQAALKKYAEATGFPWIFAVAPPELVRTIGNTYGAQFLNPPSTPVLIIDRYGVAHPLPFGLKSTQDLVSAVEPYLGVSG